MDIPLTPEAKWDGLQQGKVISAALSKLSTADPRNVHDIVASHLQLLTAYYQIALTQSRLGFFWGLVGAGAGLIFFIAATGLALRTGNTVAAVIPVISGAVVEVVAGIVFFLYGKTTEQLSDFLSRLETLQRYVLANSICEGLPEGDERNKARAALIREIAMTTRGASDQSGSGL
jgi:hypothetical protein